MNLQHLTTKLIHGIISTDDILPAKYKHSSTDPAYYGKHIFENRFPGLADTFSENNVIVNDAIFGIGSSREQAVTALLSAGVKAIIAPQFGRIFFRNAWNLALPCFELSMTVEDGTALSIDFDEMVIRTAGGNYNFPKIPAVMMEICRAGGLLAHYKMMKQHETK